jgi:hypothetical protein
VGGGPRLHWLVAVAVDGGGTNQWSWRGAWDGVVDDGRGWSAAEGVLPLAAVSPLQLLPGASGPLDPSGPLLADVVVVVVGRRSGGYRRRLLGTVAVPVAGLTAVGWIPPSSSVRWWSWWAVVSAFHGSDNFFRLALFSGVAICCALLRGSAEHWGR